jgi:hypothetical protein
MTTDDLSPPPLLTVAQTLDPNLTKILSGIFGMMTLFFLVVTIFGNLFFDGLRYLTGFVAFLSLLCAFIMPLYLKKQFERIKIAFYHDHAIASLPGKREAYLDYNDFRHVRYEQSARQKSLHHADFYFDVPFNMSPYTRGIIINNVDLTRSSFDDVQNLIKRGQNQG